MHIQINLLFGVSSPVIEFPVAELNLISSMYLYKKKSNALKVMPKCISLSTVSIVKIINLQCYLGARIAIGFDHFFELFWWFVIIFIQIRPHLNVIACSAVREVPQETPEAKFPKCRSSFFLCLLRSVTHVHTLYTVNISQWSMTIKTTTFPGRKHPKTGLVCSI